MLPDRAFFVNFFQSVREGSLAAGETDWAFRNNGQRTAKPKRNNVRTRTGICANKALNENTGIFFIFIPCFIRSLVFDFRGDDTRSNLEIHGRPLLQGVIRSSVGVKKVRMPSALSGGLSAPTARLLLFTCRPMLTGESTLEFGTNALSS